MRTQILDNGGIKIIATNEERHELAEIYRDPETGYPEAETYVHEALHEILAAVEPEWIGALTEAPIFAEDAYIDDNGEPTLTGAICWFPDYAIRDPYRELANCGRVVFPSGK